MTDRTRYSPGSVVEIEVVNAREHAIFVGQCPLTFERSEQGQWRALPPSEGKQVDECELMLWTVKPGGGAPVIALLRAQFAPGLYRIAHRASRIAHRGISAEGTEPFARLYTNRFEVGPRSD